MDQNQVNPTETVTVYQLNPRFLEQDAPGKDEIRDFASHIIQQMNEGNLDPLQVEVNRKAFAELLSIIEKGTKDGAGSKALAVDEMYHNSLAKGKHTAYGATVQLAESGTKYNYEENERYRELVELRRQTTAEIDAELEELKPKLRTGATDRETGEQYAAVTRESTTYVKITLR